VKIYYEKLTPQDVSRLAHIGKRLAQTVLAVVAIGFAAVIFHMIPLAVACLIMTAPLIILGEVLRFIIKETMRRWREQ
jgi:hypothetical protein